MIVDANINECLDYIREKINSNERTIEALRKRNIELLDEHYKDKTLSEMKEQYEKMQKNYYRGFPISEEEDLAIGKWQDEHDRKVHGLTNDMLLIKAGGICGGRYSYHFVPTSIGVSGVVRCSCGAEFEFQKIG